MRKLVSGLVPIVVVSCLLTIVGVSPAQAHGPTKKGRGVLEVVCVDRGDQSLRVPSGSCARGEDRVEVSVAERLRVRRGLVVPNNDGAWFCAAPGRGALREIKRPVRCKKGTVLESRNHRPGVPELSDAEVPEDVPVGTAVGTLTADDEDAADRMKFRLVGGDTDAFAVVDGALVTAARFDFETRADYQVRVQVTDLLGLSRAATFEIAVVDGQESRPPTDVGLDNASVTENKPAGTVVGHLSTSDPDGGDHTYTLVTEPGVANDNPLFSIAGDELRTVAPLDFEARSQLVVRVRTDDGAGGRFEKNLAVTVGDGPDAPAGITLSPSTIGENSTGTVGRLTASDQDSSERHTFSLVAGAGDRDNATFAISGDQLTIGVPADFEQRSSLTARVRVTDKDGLTYDQAVTVAVTDAAEAPTGVSLSPASVQENEPAGTTVGALAISDPDGASAGTFALVAGQGDDDNTAFRVQGGSLVTDRSFDYEADASHTVRVRGTDSSGMSVESALTVTVVNANERATRLDLSSTTVDEDAAVGTVVGTLSTDDPDLDDPITYTLLDDATGRFAVDGDELVTAGGLDREVAASHTVEVRAEDAAGESVDATFVITVANVNEAPAAPSLNDDTVDENLAPGATVGRLTATDPDAGDTLTYALVAGAGSADNAAFQIVGGSLRTAARFDFEAQATYSIRVRVTDSGTPALSTEAVLTIHVADVNEAPSQPTLSPASIAENEAPGTLVGTLAATDPDADALTYTLVDGLDSAHFSVVAGRVYALESFDFEATDSYRIEVEVTDGDETASATLPITVTDANDAPSSVSLSHASLAENAAARAIGTLSTTDQDAGHSHTYTLPAGEADNDEFVVVGDELRSTGPFDHETQPTREVLVRATDEDGAYVEGTFTITVTDVNEAPTAVSLSDDEIDENVATQDVGTLSASDPEGGAMTFALVSGAGDDDNASFRIDGTTLRATASFDHETEPALSVRVRVTDAGGLSHVQVLTITVRDVDDAPTGLRFGSGGTVAENAEAGTVVGQLELVDVDGQAVTRYVLVDGDGKFDVSPSGEVTTTGGLDFEATPQVTIQVRVEDADSTTYIGSVTITVTNLNESPTRVDLSATSVDENKPAGTVVGTLSAVDQDDEVDDPTFTLVTGGAQFAIADGDQLVTKASFDHEATASYSISIRATDAGGLSVTTPMTITVNQVNEAPSVSGSGNLAIDENLATGTTVATLAANDPESDALTWSLVGGAGSTDNAKFSITSAGVLTTAASFDHETKAALSIRVRVSDGSLADERVVTVAVNDVNDAPTVVADSYTGAVGNTYASVGTVDDWGPTVALTGSLPVANDSDQDGDPISVVATNRGTTLGGSVQILSDGSFRYLPPVGLKDQVDTFSYAVTDGASQSTGTISVRIADRRVWYLGDNNAGAPDGTARAPFAAPNRVNGSNDVDGPGDELYLFNGGYADGIVGVTGIFVLEAGQKLIGAGVALPGILPAGSKPTLSARLQMSEGVSVDGIDLTSSSSDTVTATNVDTFTIGSTASVSSTGSAAPIAIVGGNGDITVGAAIRAGGSGPVRVSNRSGGRVTFAAPISTTATTTRAISLTGNTGATVRFNGGLTLSTGGNPAFSASGGGTVEVTGTANTISTTSGTPLSVTDVTIGAAGLTFRSLSSSGAANGIVLRNTGTSGSFTLTGSGSSAECGGSVTATGMPDQNPVVGDCTGGTIAGSTGTGVVLDRTMAPSLSKVYVTGSGDDGISARSVTGGLTLARVQVAGNGNAGGDNAVELGDPDAATPQGVTGTVTITDSALGGSLDTQLYSGTSSGTTTLSLLRNRFVGPLSPGTALGAMDGVRVQATSGGSVGLTLTSGYFTGSKGDAVQVTSSGTGVVSKAAITSSTVRNNGTIGRGIQVAAGGSPFSGTLAFDIANNTVDSLLGPAIMVVGDNVTGTGYMGHVRGNQVGSSATQGSCASAGDGILVSLEDGTGSLTLDMSYNDVERCLGRGIVLEATGGSVAMNATVTNNRAYLDHANALEGFRADIGAQVGDAGTSCLKLATNQFHGGLAMAADLLMTHRYGVLQIAGTTGTPNSTAVQSLLAGTNTVALGGVAVTTPAAGGSYAGVPTCPTATN